MNCKEVEELLPLYAGRDLEQNRATWVAEHVQTCAACARVDDEYRESVQLTSQFAPPVFSEAVYAGIRQRVLREIEAEAMSPAWSQTIANLFRPRLTWATWAIAGALLVIVSMFAIYFTVIKRNDEQRTANKSPAEVQPGSKEDSNAGPQHIQRAGLLPSVKTGGKKRQLPDRRNTVGSKSPDATSTANNVSTQPSRFAETMVSPHTDSPALVKTLRLEIQTKDPKIRIIWFVQPETKPVIPSSKGT